MNYELRIKNYFVILEEKAIFLINKGSSGDWEMWRVTIWKPFSIPRSALDCFQSNRALHASLVEELRFRATSRFNDSSSVQRYKEFLKLPKE